MLGSGAIIVVDDTNSVVDVALKLAEFYRHESCGKCTPCREGTNWTVKMLERIQSGLATPMDLDIMASVQEQIIGNCLCVLGDAMAMPVGSMIAEVPRRVRGPHRGRRAPRNPCRARRRARRSRPSTPREPWRLVPRPEPHLVTFSIDGREVTAPENTMLVDGAKYGDVEIPVFCYEPKLGQPVGACRMCLVEIEGIPKLQTGCSTPVKDGMVVHTQTDRVEGRAAGRRRVPAHQPPARLPGLRQGRRVPAAGHLLRLGRRPLALHRAQAPLREAARALAADRDRPRALHPLLPLRALLPGDHRGLPARPPRARRATTFVGTFDGHPYVAPFSGNIIELCPVGALTSQPYRFRARPWDIEGAGCVCTLCPAQCNVTFTVRDERVLRVLGRDNAEVDDGWLCDKGRFAYQADPRRRAHHRSRWCATAASCARSPGSARSTRPPRACGAPAAASARWPAARRPTRRASSCSACCARPSAPPTSTRAARRPGRADLHAARPARPAGDGRRPRVRPHRPRARHRARRRHADPRPAHPQGRAPPPRQPRGRDAAPVVAGRQRQGQRPLRARRRGARRRRAGRPRCSAAT